MALKWYTQPDKTFNGQLYRARTIILDEKMIERILKVPEAIVVSSWRSLSEQKEMVAKGASKTLESNHRRGMAADIVNWKEIDKKLEAVGLVNDISWDANHYTYQGESSTARAFPIYNTFTKTEANQYKPVIEEDMQITKEQQKRLEKHGFNFKGVLNTGELDQLIEEIEIKEIEIKELRDRPPVEVIKEVPVETIKEVPKEIIKEVKVLADDLSAVELFRLALKKFLI